MLALLYIILMEVLDQDSLCAHIKELKIKSYKQLCVCVYGPCVLCSQCKLFALLAFCQKDQQPSLIFNNHWPKRKGRVDYTLILHIGDLSSDPS